MGHKLCTLLPFSIMYPYFFLKCMKIHIPRKISQLLTFLQLLQMLVAVTINAYSQFVISTYARISIRYKHQSPNHAWCAYICAQICHHKCSQFRLWSTLCAWRVEHKMDLGHLRILRLPFWRVLLQKLLFQKIQEAISLQPNDAGGSFNIFGLIRSRKTIHNNINFNLILSI